MTTFKLGQKVRALNIVIEDDNPSNPEAKPCGSGWVHAEPGDCGFVAGIDDGCVTARFDRTGTASVVGDNEIELITE